MTRSFGDHCASLVGVTAIPEIKELNLIPNDKFVILASDGIWELMSNQEAAEIVYPFYEQNSAERAAEALIRDAATRWK